MRRTSVVDDDGKPDGVDGRPDGAFSVVAVRPARLVAAVAEAATAALALVLADLAVRVVPFRVLARRLESPLRAAPQPGGAGRVRWAVEAAHRRLPWSVPCLATAVAANRLLARRGTPSGLWLGVRSGDHHTIDAHAWLVADGSVVTGRFERATYQPLHVLVTRRGD